MDKYTLDFIKNKVNEVILTCSKPQKKCFHKLLRQLFIKGTPILRHLVETGKNVKPQTRKFSRHLENVDLPELVDDFVLKQVKYKVSKETSIAYDLSDINKNDAKKMPNLSRVFDGSERNRATGFWLHGVGILGFLLKFEVHDVNSKTLPQTRKKIIFQLAEKLSYLGIWVIDRGNDCKQFFRDLAKRGIRFICRLRSNRLVVLKNSGEIVKLNSLDVGKYEIHLLNAHNNKVNTDVTFTLIVYKHLDEKDVIRLISNLPIDHYSSEDFVKKYLERWGVEKSFRRIKTKFLIEKIRVLSEKRFTNLISLIRLSMAVSKLLYQRVFENQKQVLLHICKLLNSYKNFLKRRSLTQNIDSFITFLSDHLPPLVNRKPKEPPNPSLFSHYALEKLTPI